MRTTRATVALLALALGPFDAARSGVASAQDDVLRDPALTEPIPLPDLSAFDARARALLSDATAGLRSALSAQDEEAAVAELRVLGRTWAAAYRREAALAAFRNLLARRPNDFPALYYSATIEAQLGRNEAASTLFERALSLRPGDLASAVRLGQLHLRSGDARSAEEIFRSLLEQTVREPAALFGLGEVKRLQGDCAGAIVLYDEALGKQPEAAAIRYPLAQCLRRLGDVGRARLELQRHADVPATFDDPLTDDLVVGQPSKVQLLNLATSMRASGELENAARAYREVLSFEPNDASALLGLANTLLALGQLADGQQALEQLIAVDPSNVLAHHDLAQVYWEQGLSAKARAVLEAATKKAPGFSKAHLSLAEILLEEGQEGEALKALERAYGATRAIASDRETRGWSALLLANLLLTRGPERSLLLLDEGARLLEQDAEAQQLAGQLYMRSSRFAEGAQCLHRAAELSPENPGLHFASGLAFMLAEDDASAARVLDAAAGLHPNDLSIQELLARLLSCSRNPDVRDPGRAVPLADRAFRAGPSIDRAETLAMALISQGETAVGLDWQRQAFERARTTGDRQRAASAGKRLEAYEAGRQCDAPWLPEDRP